MTTSFQFDFGGTIDDTLKNAPKGEFEAIEPGWYEAMLSQMSIKQGTKTNPAAQTLNLTFKVTSGKYANRLVFVSVTASGGNDKQMQWSRVIMGKFAKDGHGYSGDGTKFDPGAYLFKPVAIKVTKEKEKTNPAGGMYPVRNKIVEFRPASALAPTAPPASTWSKPAARQLPPEPQHDEPDEGPELEAAGADAGSTISKGGKKPWE